MSEFRKRIIILLLIAVGAGVIGSYFLASLFSELEPTDTSQTYVTSQKNAKVYTTDEVFETISSKAGAYENNIYFDAILDSDVVSDAVKKLEYYYPDYFWIGDYTITTSSYGDTKVFFQEMNGTEQKNIGAMHSELMSEAQKIADMAKENASQENRAYDIALYVHDYLAENCRYIKDKADSGEFGTWCTAYGCLVEHSAVCQGYAEAYQLILSLANIECGVNTGDGHAWNCVKIGGAYYWVDVTWDDYEADTPENDILQHAYFMMNDELLSRTRSVGENQFFVPECRSMDCNYYVMSGTYLSEYDFDAVRNAVADSSERKCAELMFDSAEDLHTAKEKLFDDLEIWQLNDEGLIGEQVNYSLDDVMCTMIIFF